MNQTLRECKRCLIPDFVKDKDQFLQTYIQQIEQDLKTEQQEYAQRLKMCSKCQHLLNGVCRLCGCFAAIRAAVKSNYCPDKNSKW